MKAHDEQCQAMCVALDKNQVTPSCSTWMQWAEGRRAPGGGLHPAHRQHEVGHPHYQRGVCTPTPSGPLCCLLQRQSLHLWRNGEHQSSQHKPAPVAVVTMVVTHSCTQHNLQQLQSQSCAFCGIARVSRCHSAAHALLMYVVHNFI